MSRPKLTVVLSQSQGKNPAKRSLEESIVAALIMEPDLEVSVVPNLYDLGPDHTGRLFLGAVSGDMVVLSWLYPRAAFLLLDRDGIKNSESPDANAFPYLEHPLGSLRPRSGVPLERVLRDVLRRMPVPCYYMPNDPKTGLPQFDPLTGFKLNPLDATDTLFPMGAEFVVAPRGIVVTTAQSLRLHGLLPEPPLFGVAADDSRQELPRPRKVARLRRSYHSDGFIQQIARGECGPSEPHLSDRARSSDE